MRLTTPLIGALLLGSFTTACGSRSAWHNLRRDAGAADAGSPDAHQPGDPCAPMDARWTGACDEPGIVGWAWDGTTCVAIECDCEGDDCSALHPTAATCWAAYGPTCTYTLACETLDYAGCESRLDCRLIPFGGGCMNLDTCSNEGPGDGNWMCWEQGLQCVNADHDCNLLGPGECDGDCYWREQTNHYDMGECEVDESWGVCAALPDDPCAPAQQTGCSDPCGQVVGYLWNGGDCEPVICCCEGPDCHRMYDTAADCGQAHAICTPDACLQTGGYCEDYHGAETCDRFEYYYDEELIAAHPADCGATGGCCRPCPDPNDPRVDYIGTTPMQCADIDWDCTDGWRGFDNACGCGCRQEPPSPW